MFKNLFVLVLIFVCISCNNKIEIVSAKRQTVYPGIRTEKPYASYVLEVTVNSKNSIVIKDISVMDAGFCYSVRYSILNKETNELVNHVNSVGKYVLQLPLNENNILKKEDCKSPIDNNKVIITYKEGDKIKNIAITSFEEEVKRMR